MITVAAIAVSGGVAAGALLLAGVGDAPSREEYISAEADRVFDENIDSFDAACRPGLIDIPFTDYIETEQVVPEVLPSGGPQEATELVIEPDSDQPLRLSLAELSVFEDRVYERIEELCADLAEASAADAR